MIENNSKASCGRRDLSNFHSILNGEEDYTFIVVVPSGFFMLLLKTFLFSLFPHVSPTLLYSLRHHENTNFRSQFGQKLDPEIQLKCFLSTLPIIDLSSYFCYNDESFLFLVYRIVIDFKIN